MFRRRRDKATWKLPQTLRSLFRIRTPLALCARACKPRNKFRLHPADYIRYSSVWIYIVPVTLRAVSSCLYRELCKIRPPLTKPVKCIPRYNGHPPNPSFYLTLVSRVQENFLENNDARLYRESQTGLSRAADHASLNFDCASAAVAPQSHTMTGSSANWKFR